MDSLERYKRVKCTLIKRKSCMFVLGEAPTRERIYKTFHKMILTMEKIIILRTEINIIRKMYPTAEEYKKIEKFQRLKKRVKKLRHRYFAARNQILKAEKKNCIIYRSPKSEFKKPKPKK